MKTVSIWLLCAVSFLKDSYINKEIKVNDDLSLVFSAFYCEIADLPLALTFVY